MSLINLNFASDDFDLSKLIPVESIVSLPLWQADLYLFLQNWLDQKDYIEVKTSGSTGIPKTIRLAKETMRQSARATNRFFSLQPGDRILLCLSASYIAGKMMVVRALEGQLDLWVDEPSSTPLSAQSQSYRFCAMVPMQVEQTLLKEGTAVFDKLESLIIGGAPVSVVLHDQLQAITTRCYATYGMTETASHVALCLLNGEISDAAFVALPGIFFSSDSRGCLSIDAPSLLSAPIQTNDVVSLIDNTRFIWKGRADFVVNSGGIKLYPEAIEKKIVRLIPCRFFISKEQHPLLGESLVLVLEGERLSEDAEKRLIAQIRECVDSYELPRRVHYQACFQETASGKLKRLF